LIGLLIHLSRGDFNSLYPIAKNSITACFYYIYVLVVDRHKAPLELFKKFLFSGTIPVMRICTTTIPFSGMKIEAILPLEALNARLSEGSERQEISFESAPHVDLTFTRTHGGILVKGEVSGMCKQECATCADPVSHEIVASIDWILQTLSDRAGPDDEIDDPGVIVYEGDHVELEEPLQEALILNINPFWHPPRDKNERCTVCKRDCAANVWRREESDGDEKKPSAFGSLLKGALSSTKKAT
jgi:uncharacterized metal-binding protein YceD (DUF177 family)